MSIIAAGGVQVDLVTELKIFDKTGDSSLQATLREKVAFEAQRLIDEMLDASIGLSRYFTYVVTKPVKGAGAPPLDVLLGIE